MAQHESEQQRLYRVWLSYYETDGKRQFREIKLNVIACDAFRAFAIATAQIAIRDVVVASIEQVASLGECLRDNEGIM